jgi:hypothetical protein
MPWWFFKNMTDDDLKAIFAYLKTVKPVHTAWTTLRPPESAGAATTNPVAAKRGHMAICTLTARTAKCPHGLRYLCCSG